eukprot:m.156004 g.156004  ORF g.156004 m.156004 type:complete len:173 (+) comp38685_c0_seq3:478-996(+)
MIALPCCALSLATILATIDYIQHWLDIEKNSLAPSLVELAGLDPPRTMDGRSFVDVARGGGKKPTTWRTDFLIDYHGEGYECGCVECPIPPPDKFHEIDCKNNTYTCLRTQANETDFLYCEFTETDYAEYYDLKKDPWQLSNTIHMVHEDSLQKMKERLNYLRKCQGETCRQ